MTSGSTPDVQASASEKLAEVEALSAQITELEEQLGIDPTHKRKNPDGLYQRRLNLYDELRRLKVPYPQIGRAAKTTGESVRAALHKRNKRPPA